MAQGGSGLSGSTGHTPAILGGRPFSNEPLRIVRPSLPPLAAFGDAFDRALRTGAVTNNGPAVVEFERRLSDYLGAEVVACSSGQAALMIMLRAAGVASGEVIVPSYTFGATPHAVRWCGAVPVFADIGSETSLCLDPSRVEPLINARTVAILGVDVYGIACDYEAFEELGRKHGLRVLYDSAPSFGTRVGGRVVGAFGDAQIFSFHATKAFSTMEGGCLASKDPELVRRARELRNFGQSRGADCDEPGMNAKMLEVCALIGIEQLKDFDGVVEHRARMARRMREGLAHLPGISLARVPDRQLPVWLYFPIVVERERFGLDRDQLALALEKENIFVRKYFELPCHHMRAYADQPRGPLPHTERIAYRVLSLPIYNDMSESECDCIVEAISALQSHAEAVRAALEPLEQQSVKEAMGAGTR
jgi:dTDP-4-amino-4,6-dideoxygalactose transaminase